MRPRTNRLSERNIKRIDTRPDAAKQTHGFQVWFSRSGKVYSKMFSDAKWGGRKRALDAARAHRDELEKNLPPSQVGRFAFESFALNTSGHIGISLRERMNANGTVVKYISASVREDAGKPVNRNFRYTDETYEKALKKALAFRRKILRDRAEREGQTESPPPKKNKTGKARKAKKAGGKIEPKSKKRKKR